MSDNLCRVDVLLMVGRRIYLNEVEIETSTENDFHLYNYVFVKRRSLLLFC